MIKIRFFLLGLLLSGFSLMVSGFCVKAEGFNLPSQQNTRMETNGADSVESLIQAQWAADVLDNYSAYSVFIADRTDAQTVVVFSSEISIENVKVLELQLMDVDENGNLSFSTEELYTLKELSPECPLVVGMTFVGLIPNYGISYVDEDGVTRNFTIEISGMDGSLLLSEF